MDHELNFSADCVINFDDLGEFKDYTEIIESLVKQMKSNQNYVVCNVVELQEVLDADSEDTFSLPIFKPFFDLLIRLVLEKNDLTEQILLKIHKLLLKVLDEHFFSYTFRQNIGDDVLRCLETNRDPKLGKAILQALYKLSERILFTDKHKEFCRLFVLIDEAIFFNQISNKAETNHEKQTLMAMYLEIVQRMFRSRKIREAYKQLSLQMSQHVNRCASIKIAIWSSNKQQMLSELTVLRDLSCYYSKLLEDTVSVWAELNLM